MNLSTKTVVISDVVLETLILSCKKGTYLVLVLISIFLHVNFEYFYLDKMTFLDPKAYELIVIMYEFFLMSLQ